MSPLRALFVLSLTILSATLSNSEARAQSDRDPLLAADKRALEFERQNRVLEATQEWEKALALATETLGSEHPTTGSLLHTLGLQYVKLGRYAEALTAYRRALAIREKEADQNPRKLLLTLSGLAQTHRLLGQAVEAEQHAQRALAWGEERLGKDNIDVALSLAILAETLLDRQQPERAEPHAVRALRIREAQPNADSFLLADSLDQVQLVYRSLGRYGEAEPLAQRALHLRRARFGDNHPAVATSLHGLGQLYQAMDRYGDAEPLFKQAIQIWETSLGKEHPNVAVGLTNLALVYRQSGQYAAAVPLYQRALAIQERKLGTDHPNVAMTLNDLSVTYRGLGQSAMAEPLALRVVAIRESRFGKEDRSVADALVNLSVLRQDLARDGEAEPDLRRAIAIYEGRFGSDSVLLGVPSQNLCDIYRRKGRHQEALPLCERSRKSWESKWGKDHPYVAINLTTQGLLQSAAGQVPQAVALLDQARRRTRRHVASVLPALSESEQLTFLENLHNSYLHIALATARRHADDSTAAELSAGWVLNGKALSLEVLAERALQVRDSGDPAVATDSRKLLDIRRQLAGLSVRGPGPGQEARHTQVLSALLVEERELALRVARGRGGSVQADPWIEIGAVRAALPPGSVLIELARYRDYDQQGWQAPRYAAWVVPPARRGPIRLVDLGEASPIESAVASARRGLESAPSALGRLGEPAAERELEGLLRAVSQLVLEPLLPHVGRAQHLIISPDADLWLLPWGALPLRDRFAIEDYRMSYVVSGRDLARSQGAPETRRPVVMADPDYDLDIATVRAETLRLAGTPASGEIRGAPTRSALPQKFARLPGTAEEAKAIKPQLERYARQEALVLLDKQALESVFKTVQRPKVLVLSTHGYFLPDQQSSSRNPGATPLPATGGWSAPSPATEPLAQQRENPLLRTGLVLAGANHRDQAREPGDEDGILTGLEIVGADLRGTQLVVLSACETGIGQVRNGEGVAGLRHAFQLAGAQSVVSTLWSIPDRETALLMTEFFTRLAKRDSRADALRNAQLSRIRHRRQTGGAAHPYYWAAFTLTGDWR